MGTNASSDLDQYTRLLDSPSPRAATSRRPLRGFVVILASVIFLISIIGLIINQNQEQRKDSSSVSTPEATSFPKVPRGVAEGVSTKSNPSFVKEGDSFNWTNAMFSWQRTAYHFQPERNWMNDPDGPLYYKGWYHLFYQYNPDSAVWGNITWGHAVSTDLIHWLYLPIAMVPNEWYDINGVWTGSATLLPDGQIVMLYTGDTNELVQVQNLAWPANLSDPLLLHWVKYPDNPVMVPPPGIGLKDFRDPTTAWMGSDGFWRLIIGSKVNKTGIALVYKTANFTTYELLDHYLHEVPGTGMWECVDFYPVAVNGSIGLDTSACGPGIKHVLKASLDDTKVDHYAIGEYDPVTDIWTPDNPVEDVGIGLKVDYGRYYASKTFFDQDTGRRILWGWINETDDEADDLRKGWASVQTIPRTVLFDNKTGVNLLEWPVEEIETLRLNRTDVKDIEVGPGSVVPIDIGTATQLDILAEFEIQLLTETVNEDRSCGGGAAERSILGPFGLLVIADASLSELTPVFFRPVNKSDGSPKTYFCADETRSSLAPEVMKRVYGGTVPVLADERFQMRVLVDHSIVESFAQGGRTVITSRVYPTKAIYGDARLFLFNNATGVKIKASLKIWQLNSAFIHPFPLDQI
ncbi:beta-fructofuranosidase, soluble isoenzyme I-like [Tripterygium wilfordii]|uniref:beta-fructofuranosidase, soluble isoenzyme I-like n=1 Tax=Tripterygium wilfordii TaxID=458696 RepID=UPI0018F819C3|nr:beta-fructofuranosidase, soluble isoenzyme I-like [Tripterygium wilfordii]